MVIASADGCRGDSGGGDSGKGSYSLRFFGGCSAAAMAGESAQHSALSALSFSELGTLFGESNREITNVSLYGLGCEKGAIVSLQNQSGKLHFTLSTLEYVK